MNVLNVRRGILHLHVANQQKPREFLVHSYMYMIVQFTKMPKGKRLCSQSKETVNQVFNYFSEMEKRCASRGALDRLLEAQVREFCGVSFLLNVTYA